MKESLTHGNAEVNFSVIVCRQEKMIVCLFSVVNGSRVSITKDLMNNSPQYGGPFGQ